MFQLGLSCTWKHRSCVPADGLGVGITGVVVLLCGYQHWCCALTAGLEQQPVLAASSLGGGTLP